MTDRAAATARDVTCGARGAARVWKLEPMRGYDPRTYGLRNRWPTPVSLCMSLMAFMIPGLQSGL